MSTRLNLQQNNAVPKELTMASALLPGGALQLLVADSCRVYALRDLMHYRMLGLTCRLINGKPIM